VKRLEMRKEGMKTSRESGVNGRWQWYMYADGRERKEREKEEGRKQRRARKNGSGERAGGAEGSELSGTPPLGLLCAYTVSRNSGKKLRVNRGGLSCVNLTGAAAGGRRRNDGIKTGLATLK
jgi:hypothetical protein